MDIMNPWNILPLRSDNIIKTMVEKHGPEFAAAKFDKMFSSGVGHSFV